MVEVVIDGVMKLVPVPTCVVKAASLYHLIISVAAPERLAFKLTVPVPHLDPAVVPGTAGAGLIVAVTIAGVLAQPVILVSVI